MASISHAPLSAELTSPKLEDIDCDVPVVDFPITLWDKDAGWSSSNRENSEPILSHDKALATTDNTAGISKPDSNIRTSALPGSAQDSPTSSTFSEDSLSWQPFEVRESPRGGNGVFATRDIPYNHTILVEDPLFIANASTVYEAVDKLSPDERKEFDELHPFYKQHNTDDIAARFSTNCFRLKSKADLSGIYTLAARFNHSCDGINNVKWSFLDNPKRDPNTNHVLHIQPNISRPASRASSSPPSSSSLRSSTPHAENKPENKSVNTTTVIYSLPDEPSQPPAPKKPITTNSTQGTKSPTARLLHLQIRAPNGVQAGQELTLNYGFPPPVLFTNWGFRCTCGGCKPAPLTDEECQQLQDSSSKNWEWGSSKLPLGKQKQEGDW